LHELIREEFSRKSARRAKMYSTQAYRGRDALTATTRPAFEMSLDLHSCCTGPTSRSAASGGKNIGPWAWDRLDHENRRELRGVRPARGVEGLFARPLGQLRLKDWAGAGQPGEERPAILHAVSDLGGALGRAENFRVAEGNHVNEFPWTFTEPPVKDRKGREKKPFGSWATSP
jgi:hypothetical protein